MFGIVTSDILGNRKGFFPPGGTSTRVSILIRSILNPGYLQPSIRITGGEGSFFNAIGEMTGGTGGVGA